MPADSPSRGSMVEVVARALAAADGVPWHEVPPRHRGEFRRRARTAISAMREPTVQMVADTLPMVGEHHDPDTNRLAEQAAFIAGLGIDQARGSECAKELIRDWRAMIDAALAEPQPRAEAAS